MFVLGPAAVGSVEVVVTVTGVGLRLSSSDWRCFTSDARSGMAVGLERIIPEWNGPPGVGKEEDLALRTCCRNANNSELADSSVGKWNFPAHSFLSA